MSAEGPSPLACSGEVGQRARGKRLLSHGGQVLSREPPE